MSDGARTRRQPGQVLDVPALVRGIRSALGLTQEALAREVGVTFSTVNGWENGKHRPIPALIARLLDLAGAASGARGSRRPARARREPRR